MQRLVKGGVDRDRLVRGLMQLMANGEALRDTLPNAGERQKAKSRRLKNLSPCLVDAAQRLEEADLYFDLPTLLGRNLGGVVKTLRTLALEIDRLSKDGPLSASLELNSRYRVRTTASIRETFIDAVRPAVEPKHFKKDMEALLSPWPK
jgi:hypothetical protein